MTSLWLSNAIARTTAPLTASPTQILGPDVISPRQAISPTHAFPSIDLVEDRWQTALDIIAKRDPLKSTPWQLAVKTEVGASKRLMQQVGMPSDQIYDQQTKAVIILSRWIESLFEKHAYQKSPPKLVFVGRASEKAYRLACMMRIRHGYPRNRIRFIENLQPPKDISHKDQEMNLYQQYLDQELGLTEDVPLIFLDTCHEPSPIKESLNLLLTPNRYELEHCTSKHPEAQAWSDNPNDYAILSEMNTRKAYLFDVYGFEQRPDGKIEPKYFDLVSARILMDVKDPNFPNSTELKAWARNALSVHHYTQGHPGQSEEIITSYFTGSLEAQLYRSVMSLFMPLCFGLTEPNHRVLQDRFIAARELYINCFKFQPFSTGLNSNEILIDENLDLPDEGLFSWTNVGTMLTQGQNTTTSQGVLDSLGSRHPHHVSLFQHSLYEIWLQNTIEKIRTGEVDSVDTSAQLNTEIAYPGLSHLRMGFNQKRLWELQLKAWSAAVIKNLIFKNEIPDKETFYTIFTEFQWRIGEAVTNAIDAITVRIERDGLHGQQRSFKIQLNAQVVRGFVFNEYIKIKILDDGIGVLSTKKEKDIEYSVRQQIRSRVELIGGVGVGEKLITAGLENPGFFMSPYSRSQRPDRPGSETVIHLPFQSLADWQRLKQKRMQVKIK